MTHNPILDELYEIRAKLLADADGDVHKYLEGVRKRERESGRLLKSQTRTASGTEPANATGEKDEPIQANR